MALRTPLLKHQAELVELIQNKTYYAILHECGCGKTLSAIAVIDARKRRFPKYRTLIICPATIVENEIDEITKHSDLSSIALVGTKQQRLVKLDRPADIYVINFEGTRIMQDQLVAKKFDLVVIDESHNASHHTSQQSKACYRICMSVPHRIIMSGTAIDRGPLAAFGQFRCLSPDIFGSSYYRFRAQFACMGGYMGKQIIKYINMDRFMSTIRKCSSIKTKDEVLDLPEQTFQTVYVDLTEEQKTAYKQLKDDFLATCKEGIVTAPVVLTRLMRFSQLTSGFYKTVEGKEFSYEKNPKQEYLVEWLKEEGHKTVVFVRFTHELRELEQRLTMAGIRYVSVHGETRDRVALVKQFNETPDILVFIGQIATASEGLNLQSASYSVFLSNGYSWEERNQAISRIHRKGQTKNCTYIDIVARDTIDDRVLKILKKKESLAGMLTSDIRSVV